MFHATKNFRAQRAGERLPCMSDAWRRSLNGGKRPVLSTAAPNLPPPRDPWTATFRTWCGAAFSIIY